MAQKLFYFSTLRGGESTTEAGAFQRCGGGGESQRARNVLVFGDGERERAVEHVAGAQGIHGMHREGRRLLQNALLVEPDRAFRAARPRQERWRQLRDLFKPLAVAGDIGGLLRRPARE